MFESLLQALPMLLAGGLKMKGAKKHYDSGQRGIDYSNQQRLTGRMEELANAQADPDSPLFQKLYQQNRAMGQQDLARTVAEIQRQNRKAVSMGRTPLLDQERGGESVFRNLMLGQQDQERVARKESFGQLDSARRALAAPYDAYNDLSLGGYKNKIAKADSYSSLGDALKSLFSLNRGRGGGGSSYYPNSGETVNWYTR